MENVILITPWTGLDAGIMIDGKLVEGERCAAGEFGHITLDQEGRICGCGRRGCVETYLSASGGPSASCPPRGSTKAFSATSHSTYSSYVDHT